jgi:NADH-quinone oxidoreductase subunit J
MFQTILFYVFAAIVLFGAVQTVTAKSPVHAALYLVLTFLYQCFDVDVDAS